jgi:tetratricopeptide (TPR) repeat protein
VNIARFILIVLILSTNASLGLAEAQDPVDDKAKIEFYREAIAGSKNDAEKAVLYKKLGDIFVSREDFKNASEEYIQALSLKNDFSEDERAQMAVYISWGEKLDEAVLEFRKILKKNPGNDPARIHLARTLSWAGKLDESLAEIKIVLGHDPNNKDALLIKANDLSWKGDDEQALPIYIALLKEEESFDARLGYTYVLIAQGKEEEARESMKLLKPSYPYQEEALTKLKAEINKPKAQAPREPHEHLAPQSHADAKYSHYRDTDGNVVHRYALTYGLPVLGVRPTFTYMHTEATDYTRRNSSDIVSGDTHVQLKENVGMGAGLGIIRYSDGEETTSLFGHLLGDYEFSKWIAGVVLSREPLNETAELIEKRIMFTALALTVSRNIADRLLFTGRFAYADFSDNNNSNDLLLALRYTLFQENPRTNVGYRFRYLNFDHQSFDGYFDPNRFLMSQVFVNASYERGRVSGFAELTGGQQSFTRYGIYHSDFVYAGSANIGYKLAKNITAEASIEGGDYALQTAAGFKYYMYGIRLSWVW